MRTLYIVGPTASGKTALSFDLAAQQPSEIINADIRQIYTPLSIGVAKPGLQTTSLMAVDKPTLILRALPSRVVPWLFDLYDTPTEISAMTFRRLVAAKVQEVLARGHQPIIVGGSMFYLKSFFFPPQEYETDVDKPSSQRHQIPEAERWQRLHEIDPIRAKELHPNDLYRVNRALDIYFQQGVLPSSCKPVFQPISLPVTIIALNPPRELLKQRIQSRLEATISSWIEEVEKLLDTPWEPFWTKLGIIGYPEVAAFIRRGKRSEELAPLKQEIFNQTSNYAKRQVCFWRSFQEALGPHLGDQLSVHAALQDRY